MRKPAISPLQRRLRRLPDAEAGVLILTLLMERQKSPRAKAQFLRTVVRFVDRESLKLAATRVRS
jgi:hypothetical protein